MPLKLLSKLQEDLRGGGTEGNELNVVVKSEPDLCNQCVTEHDLQVIPEGEAGHFVRYR